MVNNADTSSIPVFVQVGSQILWEALDEDLQDLSSNLMISKFYEPLIKKKLNSPVHKTESPEVIR